MAATNVIKSIWISPDKKIKKTIFKEGIFGDKPIENSSCTIEVSRVRFSFDSMLNDYLVTTNPITIEIGNANTSVDRELEKCIQMMHKDEISAVTITFPKNNNKLRANIKLCDFETRGNIYEWTAKEKCVLAQKHKDEGNKLFNVNRCIDASHRFSRGLKLLFSIPIPVDEQIESVDGVTIKEINKLKANLYNNLACCYSREKMYEQVIELCTRVLEIDQKNTKALHKRGYAYAETRDFERAKIDLTKVLEYDSNNTDARNKLQYVNIHISLQEADFNAMVRKMFRT